MRRPLGENPLFTPLACLVGAIILFVVAIVGLSIQNNNTAHKSALQSQQNCIKIEAIETRIREVIRESRDKALRDPSVTHAEAVSITKQSQRIIDKFGPDPCPLPK